jgi:hypothetical protein
VFWEDVPDGSDETEPLAPNGHAQAQEPDAMTLVEEDELFVR